MWGDEEEPHHPKSTVQQVIKGETFQLHLQHQVENPPYIAGQQPANTIGRFNAHALALEISRISIGGGLFILTHSLILPTTALVEKLKLYPDLIVSIPQFHTQRFPPPSHRPYQRTQSRLTKRWKFVIPLQHFPDHPLETSWPTWEWD